MKVYPIILCFLLSLFATLIIPRQYDSEDMVLHLPFIKVINDNSLYKNDYLISSSNPQNNITIYYQVIAKIVSITKLTYDDLFSILRYVYYFLCFYFFISLLRIPVGGTAIQILETEALPRALSVSFGLWILYSFFHKKYFVAILIFIISFLIHPTSAFFFISILFVYQLCKYLHKFKKIKVPLIMLSTLILAILLIVVSPIRQDWLNIISLRNSYAFLNLWNINNFIYLVMLIIPLFVSLLINATKNQKFQILSKTVILTALIFTGIHVIFVVIKPVSLIINLQLLRIWIFPSILSLFVVSYIVINKFNKFPKILIMSILLVFIIWRNLVLPSVKSKTSWIDIQQWVGGNSQQNCVFLVPFYNSGFRVYSNRSIMGEYKDGALSFYSKEFALDWNNRLHDLGYWEINTNDEIIKLQSKYKFDYLVSGTFVSNKFTRVYKNNEYKVYQITKDCN